MYTIITRSQNHNTLEISPYLFYILTSSDIFITNFDSRLDQALHQLRGVNAHEESSFVSTWLEERKEGGRGGKGRGGRRRERGEKNTVKIHSIIAKWTTQQTEGCVFRLIQ